MLRCLWIRGVQDLGRATIRIADQVKQRVFPLIIVLSH